MISVDNRYYGDAQLTGFGNGPFLESYIDHEHSVWQAIHVFYAAKAALELGDLPLIVQRFLLWKLVQRSVLHHGLHILEALD